MNRVAVVVSTFNEFERIPALIDQLFTRVTARISNWEMFVVIVDRGSSDGTVERIEEMAHCHANLELLVEDTGTDIAAAHYRGIRDAVNRLNADAIVEFDPRFGDNADTIPSLLREIDHGFDYILASERAGKISNSQSAKSGALRGCWLKRILFRFLLFFPWYVFSRADDPLSGPREGRVERFYNRLNFDTLSAKGHGYRLELLYNLVPLGAKVKEIPAKPVFPDAHVIKEPTLKVFEAIKAILLIRWIDEKTRRFLKFAVVGTLGFLINALALEFFYRTQLTAPIVDFFGNLRRFPVQSVLARKSSWSAAFAAELAIMSNFTLNNLWTFRKNIITKPSALLIKFLTFNATSFGGVIIQFFVVGLTTLIVGESLLVRQMALVF